MSSSATVSALIARPSRGAIHSKAAAAPDLEGIPGVADIVVSRDRITATLSGDVAPFVRAVASPALEDLLIEPARLEEVFFEFYAGEEDSSDGGDAV